MQIKFSLGIHGRQTKRTFVVAIIVPTFISLSWWRQRGSEILPEIGPEFEPGRHRPVGPASLVDNLYVPEHVSTFQPFSSSSHVSDFLHSKQNKKERGIQNIIPFQLARYLIGYRLQCKNKRWEKTEQTQPGKKRGCQVSWTVELVCFIFERALL